MPLGVNAVRITAPEDDDNTCSTIKIVHTTVRERLTTFKQEEIGKIEKYITDNEDILGTAIDKLKKSLRKAAVSQFGVTMFEILNLYDDHFHFMNSIKEFNEHSYTNDIKQTTMSIDYKLLDVDDKIQKYRQLCLSCSQVRRRRSK